MSCWLIAVGGALIAHVDGGAYTIEVNIPLRNLGSERGGSLFSKGRIFGRNP